MAQSFGRALPRTFPRGIFYGWVIVGVSLLTNVASTPVNAIVFSLFIGDITDDTGWGRSAVSLALTFRLLVAAVSVPIIGRLVDRHGSRWLSAIGAAVIGASLLAIAGTSELWAFYVLFAITGGVGLGAPGGSVLTQVPPAKWFVARRGRALSISAAGLPGGAVLILPIATLLKEALGWRGAWATLGIGTALIVIPLNLIFMRRAPEDHGLRPDGVDAPRAASGPSLSPGVPPEVEEVSWTASEVVRTTAFWIPLVAFALMGVVLTGTLIHRVSFWRDEVGLSSTVVALGIATDPFSVIFTSLVWGWLSERLEPRYLGIAAGTGFALSMLPMLLTNGEAYTIFLQSLIWGVAGGAFITLNNVIWPTFFGRAHLGSIRGLVLPVSLAATALGAPAYGLLLDAGIEFRTIWLISLTVFAFAGGLLFLTRQPSSRPQQPERPEQPAPA